MSDRGKYARFRNEDDKGEAQLKSQTIGLVHLNDFRKRRAEAFADEGESAASRSPTPQLGDVDAVKFKKRKTPRKGGLSFGDDDGDADNSTSSLKSNRVTTKSDKKATHDGAAPPTPQTDEADSDISSISTPSLKRGFAANSSVVGAKVQTKSALLREAQLRESLRKEFFDMQERVRATPFVVPFVFYDGIDTPGGTCRMLKGDQIWRFLDKARKVGAGQGGSKGLKTWARISVDDLMLVREDLILPHHYEFYYFLLNQTRGYEGRRMFSHSAEPTSATPSQIDTASSTSQGGLTLPGQGSLATTPVPVDDMVDATLEGANDDPSLIKVVDRRWYEKNKHIFPQNIWQDFDPAKDYSTAIRKDTQGNTYFAGG